MYTHNVWKRLCRVVAISLSQAISIVMILAWCVRACIFWHVRPKCVCFVHSLTIAVVETIYCFAGGVIWSVNLRGAHTT